MDKYLFVLMVLTFISVFACYYIAKNRHASAMFWALMGAIFGPLAIPFAFYSNPESE